MNDPVFDSLQAKYDAMLPSYYDEEDDNAVGSDTGSIHYVAMSGMHGYLPDYVSCYGDLNSAAGAMTFMFELDSQASYRKLVNTGYLELNPKTDGAEYIEIIECNCSNPKEHDPEYEDE